MTRHISFPGAAVGSGAAGAATTGVSAGGGTDATGDCVATPAERGRLRPAINNKTPAAPTKIHFGKRRRVACSTPRRVDGAVSAELRRTTTGGTETGATASGGTETGDATGGGGAGGGTVGSGALRAALISASVQRVCGFGS